MVLAFAEKIGARTRPRWRWSATARTTSTPPAPREPWPSPSSPAPPAADELEPHADHVVESIADLPDYLRGLAGSDARRSAPPCERREARWVAGSPALRPGHSSPLLRCARRGISPRGRRGRRRRGLFLLRQLAHAVAPGNEQPLELGDVGGRHPAQRGGDEAALQGEALLRPVAALGGEVQGVGAAVGGQRAALDEAPSPSSGR